MALLWRWTGDDRFRDEMYDFAVRNLRYVVRNLDADGDGWPEGLGNVERTGMGPEKLDNTVYFIRGLYDLADMARSKHDGATVRVGDEPRPPAAAALRRHLVVRGRAAVRRLAERAGQPAVLPEALDRPDARWRRSCRSTGADGPRPGAVRPRDTALAGRENPCYSGEHPLNPGLFHTGCGGGPDGQGEEVVFGLTTSIQSIGEGNYGRLGPGQQQRYTHALAETMFSEPATGGTPDEQPGAMPEIFPSPDQGANIDRCWTCRSMFMQAWGNYGTAWAVVHQWLGVRPDLGRGRVEVRPAGAAGPDLGAGTGHPARAAAPPTCWPPTPGAPTGPRSRRPGRRRTRGRRSATRSRAARSRRRSCSTGGRCTTTGPARPTVGPR